MISTQIYRLKDYDLACSAQTCDGGKFEPSLVISRHIWASRPRMIAMRRGAHLTAHAVIEFSCPPFDDYLLVADGASMAR